MKKFVFVLMVLLVSFGTFGCAGLKFDQQSPVLELAVRAATGRVLTENPNWVKPTYDISSEAIFVIETGKLAQLALLEDYVVAKLPDSLTPEEHALAVVLIGTLRQAIVDELDRKGVKDPEQIKVRVVRVLTWINQTAAFRLAS